MNSFSQFITQPPQFYTPLRPRYANARGARCDRCSQLVREHFGAPGNVDLCVECFIAVQRNAADGTTPRPSPSRPFEPTPSRPSAPTPLPSSIPAHASQLAPSVLAISRETMASLGKVILSVDDLCMQSMPCKHYVSFADGSRALVSAPRIYATLKQQKSAIPAHIEQAYQEWQQQRRQEQQQQQIPTAIAGDDSGIVIGGPTRVTQHTRPSCPTPHGAQYFNENNFVRKDATITMRPDQTLLTARLSSNVVQRANNCYEESDVDSSDGDTIQSWMATSATER